MRLSVIFILLCLPLLVFSQELRFQSLSPDNGLSQGTVWKIIQDRNGFMWMATDDGLNRYDGYSFLAFKFNPQTEGSISDNNVYDVVEDCSGNLWIATAYGLNLFNPITQLFIHYISDSSNHHSLPDNQLRCLAYDPDSNIVWIGTDGGNLVKFYIQNNHFQNIPTSWKSNSSPSDCKIRSLYIDDEHIVWVGTNGAGLFALNPKSGIFKPYKQTSDDPAREILKNKITCIFEDKLHQLWIGTDGGHLSLLNQHDNEFVDFGKDIPLADLQRKGRIRAVLQDNHNTIWVATYGGLSTYNCFNHKFSEYYTHNTDDPFSLSSDRLLSLYLDKSGSIWIGNWDNGLNILNNTTPWFSHLKKDEKSSLSLTNNIVLSFCEDPLNNLLIGTYEGMNYYDRKNNTIRPLFPEIKKPVLSIYNDSTGNLWMGTWGGGLIEHRNIRKNLTYYTSSESPGSLANNTILCIYPDQINNSVLWIGTYGGLCKFDTQTKSFRSYTKKDGLSSDVIFCIEGNKDTLWLGTKDGGFSVFTIQTNSFENYVFDKKNLNSISSNMVHQILNADSVLFISTKRGINIFNKSARTFRYFDEKDGLPNSTVWAALPDSRGLLWISSNGGISRFNPKLDGNNAFRNFTISDGIQGNEFNQGAFYKSKRTGELFFGGVNGANYFVPEQIDEKQFIPPVKITSFKLFDNETQLDTSILLKKQIKLSYRENFLSFEFVSLDYSDPQKNMYSFMMEGLDKTWSKPSNRRYAAYPDLKPGEYTFRIKATNSQGFWNETGATLKISINPPFWQTYWFISICIIVIIFSVITYIKVREKNLIEEKRILEETVAERTMELRIKNQNITSSIQYAKRIQEAIILPNISSFGKEFDDSFILFRPKDIVSGDFFWYTKIGNQRIFAVADCTGHGVPGAFMSIIGNNLLEKIVSEKGITRPDLILNNLKEDLVHSLNQDGASDTKDGMDIAVISNETGSQTFLYAGAYRPLIRISSGELIKYSGDKISIGGTMNPEAKFTCNTIEMKQGDCIYLFSDGYPDQFGGPKNKKFLLKQLTDLLINIHNQSMIEQDIAVEETLTEWIGDYSQIDDVLLVGMRIH